MDRIVSPFQAPNLHKMNGNFEHGGASFHPPRELNRAASRRVLADRQRD